MIELTPSPSISTPPPPQPKHSHHLFIYTLLILFTFIVSGFIAYLFFQNDTCCYVSRDTEPITTITPTPSDHTTCTSPDCQTSSPTPPLRPINSSWLTLTTPTFSLYYPKFVQLTEFDNSWRLEAGDPTGPDWESAVYLHITTTPTDLESYISNKVCEGKDSQIPRVSELYQGCINLFETNRTQTNIDGIQTIQSRWNPYEKESIIILFEKDNLVYDLRHTTEEFPKGYQTVNQILTTFRFADSSCTDYEAPCDPKSCSFNPNICIGTQNPVTIRGTITEVDHGCAADGFCSLKLDNIWVKVVEGGLRPADYFTPTQGDPGPYDFSQNDISSYRGQFAVVYGNKLPDGTITIYGDQDYYISRLRADGTTCKQGCPLFTPFPPDWCSDGTVVSSPPDECDCPQSPTCQL